VVLHTPLSGTPYLPVADPRSARAGDPVFTMGFPAALYLGPEPKFSAGGDQLADRPGPRGRPTPHQRADAARGLRQPSADDRRTVVGVVTAAVKEEDFVRDTGALPQNLNWAVKIDYATPLFDVPRGRSAPGDRPAARMPREVVEQASQAVCIVLAGP
jgi:hypothetical protein